MIESVRQAGSELSLELPWNHLEALSFMIQNGKKKIFFMENRVEMRADTNKSRQIKSFYFNYIKFNMSCLIPNGNIDGK